MLIADSSMTITAARNEGILCGENVGFISDPY
jgi:hypothetical protein